MSGIPAFRSQSGTSKALDLTSGQYVVPDMMHGLQSRTASDGLQPVHPLQASEEQWHEHKLRMDYMMLKKSQGIHAPLKLQMEQFAVSKMQRLPCLHSSNILMDTLTGRDDLIGFEDILNNPADSEVMGQPHAMVEKRLGLL